MDLWYIKDDGGRKLAGYKGTTRDCVLRATCIFFDVDYQITYKLLNKFCKPFNEENIGRYKKSGSRVGVSNLLTPNWFESFGLVYVPILRTKHQRYKRANLKDLPELKKGKYILNMRKHVACVKDGILYDSWDSRNNVVYGYYRVG